jgi:hypothetical protein
MNGTIRRIKMADKKNPFSSYYNYPKAWGEAPEEERWHSDPSEQGVMPPWIKDAFGHGTEKPAPKLSEVDEKVKNAYVIDKHEDLETLLMADVDEKDYVHAAIKFERKKIKEQESSDNGDGIFGSLKRYSMDKRYNKSYDELYSIFSEAYKNARKQRKEDTSAVQRFTEEQTNIPYYNIGSKTKGIIEL